MNPHEDISSWMDGEDPSAASAAMPEKILHDPENRQRWNEWHLIGDAVRSASLARSSSVAHRVAQRLESEPLHFPRATAFRKASPRYRSSLVYGGAVAAAVAFVAFITFGPPMQQGGFVDMLAGNLPSTLVVRAKEAPMTSVVLEDARVRDLIDAHGSMSIRPVSVEVR